MQHSQDSPHPRAAHIAIFPRRVGQTDTLVGINLQWELRAPLDTLPWVNSLRICAPPLPGPPGLEALLMPPYEEVRRAHEQFVSPASQDRFTSEPNARPVLAGSVTAPGSAEWFFYSPEPCADDLAEAISAQFPTLKVEARSQMDPDWSIFREFLMPSPLERHFIQNRQSFHEALDDGFVADGFYTLSHILWFHTSHERYDFAMDRALEDFELHYPDEDALVLADLPTGQPDEEVAEFGLTISRPEDFNPERLDELVAQLFKAATRHDGTYEGWLVRRT